MSQSPNKILNSLPQNVFVAMQPHLQPVTLAFGELVAESSQTIRKVYFPYSGIVSLVVVLQRGDTIETAMVGRDGVVNASAALDSKLSLNKGIIQVEGAAAAIDPDTNRGGCLRVLRDGQSPL